LPARVVEHGIHDRLKIDCPKGRVGSNPTPGIRLALHYRANMRSLEEISRVQALVGLGLNDCAIARLAGIPRTTVRDWRKSQRWVQPPRRFGANLDRSSCPHCGHPAHAFDELDGRYAYLLGLYLGDGYIVHHRRGVYRLTVTLDAKYPGIVSECRDAIAAVMPTGSVGIQFRFGGTCAWVINSSKQWPCLLPQHGPGKKHERLIELTDWQEKIVASHRKDFVRGLIHSDGCRFINRVRHGSKVYEYPRYNFTNRSTDIRRIFCESCDRLGIEWRVMNAWNISVARRSSVERLDEFIGPKT
jgi:hypothetical protein